MSSFTSIVVNSRSEDTDGVQLNLVRDQLAVLSRGDKVEFQAGDQASRLLLVAGKPLNEPVARGDPAHAGLTHRNP